MENENVLRIDRVKVLVGIFCTCSTAIGAFFEIYGKRKSKIPNIFFSVAVLPTLSSTFHFIIRIICIKYMQYMPLVRLCESIFISEYFCHRLPIISGSYMDIVMIYE